MLLWVSAVGLAGAGWFGWLIWRDYDWAAPGWSGIAIAGRSNHNLTTQSGTQAQTGSSSSGIVTSDLLGSTQTDWATGQGTATPDQITDDESVNDSNDAKESVTSASSVIPDADVIDTEPETTQPVTSQPNLSRTGEPAGATAYEDYGVGAEDNTVANAPIAIELSATLEPDLDSTDEDFVVVGTSHALAQNGATVMTGEDYVVADQPGEELDDELPEIDLADYMNQWTPMVPKIAALITHELWPQLRSYLESLPQFGDVNLERVVNAVAEDSSPNTGNADGVGEEASAGFAFYANLFEEMENGAESVDVATEQADLVIA